MDPEGSENRILMEPGTRFQNPKQVPGSRIRKPHFQDPGSRFYGFKIRIRVTGFKIRVMMTWIQVPILSENVSGFHHQNIFKCCIPIEILVTLEALSLCRYTLFFISSVIAGSTSETSLENSCPVRFDIETDLDCW